MLKSSKITNPQLKRLVANFLNSNLIALSNGHLRQYKPSDITILDKVIEKGGDGTWDILKSVTFTHQYSCIKRINYGCNVFSLEYVSERRPS